MAVIRKFPGVISIIDVVSSFSAMPIPKDELGIDIMITGSQKALALPPGLSLVSVSKRALERAAGAAERGYYFDLVEFQKNHENGMTPEHADHPDHLRAQVQAGGHQGRGRRRPATRGTPA